MIKVVDPSHHLGTLTFRQFLEALLKGEEFGCDPAEEDRDLFDRFLHGDS